MTPAMQRALLLPLFTLLLALPGLRAADAPSSLSSIWNGGEGREEEARSQAISAAPLPGPLLARSSQGEGIGSPNALAPSTSAPPVERLSYHTDARWGRVLAIRNDASQPTPAEVARRPAYTPAPSGALFNRDDLGQPDWTNAIATARDFLDDSRSRGRQSAPSAFLEDQRRLTSAATTNAFDPDTDLALVRAERDALGMTQVRFAQTFYGFPVFGADANVHLAADGRVSSAGARLVPDGPADLQPALNREQAVAVALWQAQFHRAETPEASSAALCLLAPGLLKNDGNPATYLVWEVKLLLECKETGRPSSAEDYYLDAHTGSLRAQLTETLSLDRKVFDCSQPPPGNPASCPIITVDGYRYGRVEGDPPVGPCPRYLPAEVSVDTDTIYDTLSVIHQFYQTHFGRNGASNQGGTGDGYYFPTRTYGFAYLDFDPDFTCPNAMMTRGRVAFCKDMVIDDVVAHEYAHAVVMHCFYSGGLAVGMTYQGESGALNESHSDVMGEMFELAKTGSTDWIHAGTTRWGPTFGRFLYDPPANTANNAPAPNPDRFHSQLFYCGSEDRGGVHQNSTVPSKAAWLRSRGGHFNGCTITALGEAKVEQIVYRAVTQYYAQTETFNGAYAKLIQAATDLYGAGSDEVRQTTRALQAVELDQPGYCRGIPRTRAPGDRCPARPADGHARRHEPGALLAAGPLAGRRASAPLHHQPLRRPLVRPHRLAHHEHHRRAQRRDGAVFPPADTVARGTAVAAVSLFLGPLK